MPPCKSPSRNQHAAMDAIKLVRSQQPYLMACRAVMTLRVLPVREAWDRWPCTISNKRQGHELLLQSQKSVMASMELQQQQLMQRTMHKIHVPQVATGGCALGGKPDFRTAAIYLEPSSLLTAGTVRTVLLCQKAAAFTPWALDGNCKVCSPWLPTSCALQSQTALCLLAARWQVGMLAPP